MVDLAGIHGTCFFFAIGSQEAEEDFVSMYAYNRSKLCALMFVLEAADRWRDVSCLAVHPGNMVSIHRIVYIYRLRRLPRSRLPLTRFLPPASLSYSI